MRCNIPNPKYVSSKIEYRLNLTNVKITQKRAQMATPNPSSQSCNGSPLSSSRFTLNLVFSFNSCRRFPSCISSRSTSRFHFWRPRHWSTLFASSAPSSSGKLRKRLVVRGSRVRLCATDMRMRGCAPSIVYSISVSDTGVTRQRRKARYIRSFVSLCLGPPVNTCIDMIEFCWSLLGICLCSIFIDYRLTITAKGIN